MATTATIAPPPTAAPATEPTTAPELAPVPFDVSRIVWLAQALAAADASRQVSTKHLALAELLNAVRALPAGAVPMLPRVEPLEKVRREVNRDGLTYELQQSDRFLQLKILDVTGDDTLAHFEPAQARQLISDLRAVLAAVEGTVTP